jgi:hypothetical protein
MVWIFTIVLLTHCYYKIVSRLRRSVGKIRMIFLRPVMHLGCTDARVYAKFIKHKRLIRRKQLFPDLFDFP